MSNIFTTMGERIEDLMKEKGVTGKQVAEAINMTPGNFSKLINGENTNPKSNAIINLSKYFNVTSDYLLGLTTYKTEDAAIIGKETGLSEKSIKRLSYIKNHKFEGLSLIDKVIQNNVLIENWMELTRFLRPSDTDLRNFLTVFINEMDAFGSTKEDLKTELAECGFNISEQNFKIICNFIDSYLKICEISDEHIVEGISLTSTKDFGQILYFLERNFNDIVNEYIKELRGDNEDDKIKSIDNSVDADLKFLRKHFPLPFEFSEEFIQRKVEDELTEG